MIDNLSISKITRQMDLIHVLADNMRGHHNRESTLSMTIDTNDNNVLYDEDGKPIETIKASEFKQEYSRSFNDIINKPKVDKRIDGVDRLD